MTIGAEFKSKALMIDDEKVRLQIWDLAGQYRTKYSVTRNFFKNANGVIITFRFDS